MMSHFYIPPKDKKKILKKQDKGTTVKKPLTPSVMSPKSTIRNSQEI